MNSEEDMKNICHNFLQSFEEGNCAYNNELSKQTAKHYYRMRTTKQFFTDLHNCSELSKHFKEINHLINLIKIPDYIRQKELINKNRLLKKQNEILEDKLKGHTRFTCPQCSCNIKEMAEKRNQDYIEKNNLQTYRVQIERQSNTINDYNICCRRLETKLRDKDILIEELKQKITDLKTEHIHDELIANKKKKKKKKTSLSNKQIMKMIIKAQNASSSEEEESSSDEEY
tara:strand:+ start:594 stop:1280 length:687 start_codon:yes stop_codon:yes gene_type:complete